MNADTIAIVVAILGVGLALWRAIAAIRQDMDSRLKDLFQDLGEIRQDIKDTNARIDSLRQEMRTDIAALRQEMRTDIAALRQEMRTDIAALHTRIDALYQALFNHKEPAA